MRRVKLADVVEACRVKPYSTSTWVAGRPTPLLVDGRLWGPIRPSPTPFPLASEKMEDAREAELSATLAAMASRPDLRWLLPVHPEDMERVAEWECPCGGYPEDHGPDGVPPATDCPGRPPNVVLALMVSGANDLDGSVLSCSYCSWDTEIATDPGTQPTCLDCRREAESSDEAIERFAALPNATAFLWDGTEPLDEAITSGLIREGDTVVSAHPDGWANAKWLADAANAAEESGVHWEDA
jgi:hypothetical protein